ncbi:MAG: hypothetical protein KGJ70_07305 [Gemmatimonadota bacterium]|nr:hypothetical protein [Gemmatimonadota bacterium]
MTAARTVDARRIPLPFVALAASIYALEYALAHSAAAAAHPALPLAVTLDLTLVVPALYWLLVIRPAGAPPARVVAVFVLSILGARLVLRPDQREYLSYARFLGAPVELALIAWVAVKVRRAARGFHGAGADADVPERIGAALADAFPYPVVGRVFATELALGWYAFASWRRPPHVPPGTRAFTYHCRSGLVALLSAVVAACVVELFVVHLVVRAFSPRAAWALSAVSAVGVVWLVGLARAIVLRPVLVTASGIAVRSGALWTLDVPFAALARADTGRVAPPARGAPGVLRVGGNGRPTALLTLRQPLVARGPYGRSKAVTTVALVLDEPAAFADAISG